MKNRLLKHDTMHTELRMYRLIVKAQGQRNRPPRYDLKLTSIMKRVTELGDVQDNFETDMHVRHQDMMLEMVGLRNDMREMMLRSGHGGKTAGSIARGAKVKLSRWAARARRTSNQNRHQGATAAAALPLERVCYGAACFAGTHLVTASLSAVGALSLGCVGRRSRGLYQRIWTSEDRLMRVREEVG